MPERTVAEQLAEIARDVWEHVEEIDALRPEWSEVFEARKMPGVRYNRVRGYKLYGGVRIGEGKGDA